MVRISVAANADLTTNSFATRRMLRRMRRPSTMPFGIAAKSSATRTMSETPRAICEPVPRATDSRAAFIAGTSLTPSPTIAV